MLVPENSYGVTSLQIVVLFICSFLNDIAGVSGNVVQSSQVGVTGVAASRRFFEGVWLKPRKSVRLPGFPFEFRAGSLQHAEQNRIVEENKFRIISKIKVMGFFAVSSGWCRRCVAVIIMVERFCKSVILTLT